MPHLPMVLAGINPLDWSIIRDSLFAKYVFEGIAFTVLLSIFGQVVGSLIGLMLYFMRSSKIAPFRWFTAVYIWLFRGTPLLVQVVVFWQIFPYLGIANTLDHLIYFKGVFGTTFDYFLTGVLGAAIALALNEGAYMAEIVRAGIDSIDPGQMEAAKSLGMTYGQGMRRIVLPQAFRVIVPPLGNEFNSMLKNSALASTAGVYELFGLSASLGRATGAWLSYMIIAVVWYLVMTTIWGLIQRQIEQRLNASNIDPALRVRGTWWQRLIGTSRGEPVVVTGAPAQR
jgi:polar amino acid transport system permease protein